jgi:hypothetical protein
MIHFFINPLGDLAVSAALAAGVSPPPAKTYAVTPCMTSDEWAFDHDMS